MQSIPPLVLALAQVLSTNRKDLKPHPFRPAAFDARDDELLREKSFTIYDEMFRDGVVRDALRAANAPLLQSWGSLPRDPDDPVSGRVAEFCSDVLEGMQGGFLRRFRKVLNARRYGFACLEPEFMICQQGRWAGLYVHKDWHYRLPHFLDPRQNPETGELEIHQRQPDGKIKTLPGYKAIFFSWLDDLDPLRGEGDLRAAYRPWWLKDTCIKLVAIHMEMLGTGRPSIGWDTTVLKEISTDHITHSKNIIENFQKAMGIMLLPGMEFEFLEGTPAADHYLKVIEYCDAEIRRIIGKPELLSEQNGDTGSRALATVQKGQHSVELGEIQNDLEELVTEQVFRPLLFWNAIPERYLPRFTLSPPAADEASAERVSQFLAATSAGVIQVRTADEGWLRQQLGAPPIEDAGDPVAATSQPLQDGSGTEELARLIYGRKAKAVKRAGGAKLFAREDHLVRELQALEKETGEELQALLVKLLQKLYADVENTFIAGDLKPEQTLSAIRGLRFDLSSWAKKLAASGKKAYRISKAWAESSLTRTFADTPINAAGVEDIGAFEGLLESRSFTIAEGMENEVLQALKRLLEKAYQRGEPYRDTKRDLNDLMNGFAGGRIVGPGASPGSTFKSPLIQETIVRTMHADAADKAKLDAFKRNEAFVVGIERFEVIEGERNHPLSKYVAGLKIPMDHPLVNEFVGAMHYNDRGGIRSITVREAEAPGFQWSTDAQIRSAVAKKRQLSPRF